MLVFVDVAGIGAGPEANVGGLVLDRRAASVAATVDGMVAVEGGRLTPGAACAVVDAYHPLIRREHIEGVASVLADSGGVAAVAVVESGSTRADRAALRAFRVSPAQSVGSDATWNVHYRIPWSAALLYVGNDVNDVHCLVRSGCGVVVADAYPEAIRAADLDPRGAVAVVRSDSRPTRRSMLSADSSAASLGPRSRRPRPAEQPFVTGNPAPPRAGPKELSR